MITVDWIIFEWQQFLGCKVHYFLIYVFELIAIYILNISEIHSIKER
jgi:hypothetical protein